MTNGRTLGLKTVAFLAFAFVIAMVCYGAGSNDPLEACQIVHGFDTCFSALNP